MYKLIFVLILSMPLHSTVFAQTQTLSAYTIQLNYRQADDVMPLIKPFLHPDGAMTGQDYKILLKTSDKNYHDLLQFVAEIDVLQRRLRVSVTLDSELAMRENQALQAPPAVSGEESILASSNTKQLTTARRNKSALTQQVLVLEGKWANISAGESVPVGQRTRNPDGTITESITYQSVQRGFRVLPRISGEQLSLFIRPQLDSQYDQDSSHIQTHSAETTLTGKLNHWILLGGASEAAVQQPGSRVYSIEQKKASDHQIFVKVEVTQ